MKRILFLFLSLVLLSISACGPSVKEPVYSFDYHTAEGAGYSAPDYPQATFMVFSDPHYYDKSLGTEGAAFEDYLANDRKLLVQSEELMAEAVAMITNAMPEFVIVPGDLTKDGAVVSHSNFATYLAQIESAGIETFVVPGNHDLINPHAVAFEGEETKPVDYVTPESFVEIYAEYGFDHSIKEDPDSLSYVAEPVDGLWFLCLDATITSNNIEEDYPTTDGNFEANTRDWIEEVLIEANEQGKAVLAMFHHGLVPHWDGQEIRFNEYLLEGYESLSEMFANYNVRAVFTGHYHSQDVALRTLDNGKFVYDIETGSLVTYPCPIRTVSIEEGNMMRVTSSYIESIPSHPEGFRDYAKDFVYEGVYGIGYEIILGYNVKASAAEYLASMVATGFVAHYEGDEKPEPGQDEFDKKGLGIMGRLVANNQGYVLKNIWKDTEGADNNILINLSSGAWEDLSE